MTTVETSVAICISPESMNLEALESQIAQALQQTGHKLLVRTCQRTETDLLERQKPRLRRSKKRPLHLLTRFGWLKLRRFGCMLYRIISSP